MNLEQVRERILVLTSKEQLSKKEQEELETLNGMEQALSGTELGEGFDEIEAEPGEDTETEVEPEPEPEAEPKPLSQSPFEFDDPDLKGKSREEIQALYRLNRQASQELGRRLTEVEHARQAQSVELPTNEDHYADPVGSMQRLIEAALEKQIAPLKEDLVSQRREGMFVRAREKFPHFAALESMIRNLASSGQLQLNTEADLQGAYYVALGYATDQGIPFEKPAPASEPTPTRRPAQVIPQNRPSPTPNPDQTKKKLRELTETEAHIAKRMGLSKEEYLKEQDLGAQVDIADSPEGSK